MRRAPPGHVTGPGPDAPQSVPLPGTSNNRSASCRCKHYNMLPQRMNQSCGLFMWSPVLRIDWPEISPLSNRR